jgi:hypothetical protein
MKDLEAMTPEAAAFIVWLGGLYLLVGFVFAGFFVMRWAARLDAAAGQSTRGFRVMLFPGAAILWPLLVTLLLAQRSR